jgi:2-dehydro-3-deoxygalactonokinase
MADDLCAVYVDMGTTNTRAWLMRREEVIARASRATGVRDVARDGNRPVIHSFLRDLIAELKAVAMKAQPSATPACIAGSGMITSSLGLAEVPHIQAPAGMKELVAAARWYHFPEISELPVLLVPGVRTGAANSGPGSIQDMDVMRGEETLCAGLIALRLLTTPSVVVNLGSHWKAIRLDEEGKILFSVTSLSGELIHTAQSQTILASSVSNTRPTQLSQDWIEAGMREQRRSGLARALFCIRLLDLAKQGTHEERLSFLVGAVIASDLDALRSRRVLDPAIPVAIVGHEGIAKAWFGCLAGAGVSANVIAPHQSDRALLSALHTIALQAIRSTKMEPALHEAQ